MIPKIIHYCWFGRGKMPELGEKCIKSWKKFFPDYEIKEWNEDNFDVNIIPYTAEAYQAKKYAFVSDYARFWILYHFGGIYFDTDVEVIKPMDEMIELGSFMGCENVPGEGRPLYVAPGLGLGCEKGHPFYKACLDKYGKEHFVIEGKSRPKTVVEHITELLVEHGLQDVTTIQQVDGIWIYPKEYMCPIDQNGQAMHITDKTVSIHHYASSWADWKTRYKRKLAKIIGSKLSTLLVQIKRKLIR